MEQIHLLLTSYVLGGIEDWMILAELFYFDFLRLARTGTTQLLTASHPNIYRFSIQVQETVF